MKPVFLILIVVLLIFIVWFYSRYKKLISKMNESPSEKLINLTDANFKQSVSKGVVLVDFWADWCQPCKILGPVISEIADEISEKAKVCKLDVQAHQRTAQELGIRNIPTVIIFKDGKQFERVVGVKPKKTYLNIIENALKEG